MWPLNISVCFIVTDSIIYFLEQQTISGYLIACAVFIVGGSSVEFWWPVLAFGIGTLVVL